MDELRKRFIDDTIYELCGNCGYARWRHIDGHPCKKYVADTGNKTDWPKNKCVTCGKLTDEPTEYYDQNDYCDCE